MAGSQKKIICRELSPSIFGKTSQYLREFNSHRSMSVRHALQKHCWGRVALTMRTPAEIAQIFPEMWWRCWAPSCTFTGSVCFVCISAAASKFSRWKTSLRERKMNHATYKETNGKRADAHTQIHTNMLQNQSKFLHILLKVTVMKEHFS